MISFRRMSLIASAIEPLIIHNQLLGYELTYFLDYFNFHYDRGDIYNLEGEQHFTFGGECLFHELKTTQRVSLRKWDRNRENLYKGSQRHFFYSLYHDELEENGFIMKEAWFSHHAIESFNKTVGPEFRLDSTQVDSIQHYLPDYRMGDYLYYQSVGQSRAVKCLFDLEPGYRTLQYNKPLLIIYTSVQDARTGNLGKVCLMHVPTGFVTIDDQGDYMIQNGQLEWRYLDSFTYVKDFMPKDYYPKTQIASIH